MKIAICGGTFDPFHRGHLEPVLAACEPMEWDRICYVPARRQPFKLDVEMTEGSHRFAMAILATEEHDEVSVSPMELERDEVSYSVGTLEVFRTAYPEATIDWVIGDDNLAQLDEWRDIDRIFELANFVVLSRGASAAPQSMSHRLTSDAARPRHGAIVMAKNATVPVSATEIRRRVRAGEPIESLVDPRVARYIHHYQLYLEKGCM